MAKQPKKSCEHYGDHVTIGDHTIYAGGAKYLHPEDMGEYDLLVSLRDEFPDEKHTFGETRGSLLYLPVRDFQIVPQEHWETWLDSIQHVASVLTDGKKVIVFCAGGHGRTGLFLASLLALLEEGVIDPVATLRERYCHHAVETPQQTAQVTRAMNQFRGENAAATKENV